MPTIQEFEREWAEEDRREKERWDKKRMENQEKKKMILAQIAQERGGKPEVKVTYGGKRQSGGFKKY